MIGESVGNYQVLRKVGEGGMGAVYLAEHKLLGRQAAVKVLLPGLSRNADFVQRFFNEAKATSVIKHPGLVDIFDFGTLPESGCAYLVMEFLDGEALAARIRREGSLPGELVVSFSRQVASALAAAHAKSIVHRDLKPDNVFLVPDEDLPMGIRVKILDFGIAKLAGDGAAGSIKTRTGAVMGTPAYMSPEQCRGAGLVDHRTDIYALGCMMFEMACGRVPFVGEGHGDVMAAHLRDVPPTAASLGVTLAPSLEAIVQRMLRKKMDERPQTMADVIAALDAITPGRTPSAPSLAPVGLAATVALPAVSSPSPSASPSASASASASAEPSESPFAEVPTTISPRPPAPSAPKVTTLGQAATEMQRIVPPEQAPRRGWLVSAAVAVVLVAAGGLVLALRPTGGTTAIVTPVVTPELVVPKTPPPEAPIRPSTSRPEPALAAPPRSALPPPESTPTVAAPAKVKLRIESEPSGAKVYDADKQLVGTTPFSRQLDRSAAPLEFRLKLAGHSDGRVSFRGDRDDVRKVKLAPVAHGVKDKVIEEW